MSGVTAAQRLILDVDQVLLDTRPSFYAAAKRVVEEVGGALSDDDIAIFKAAGGFNDDWEMARAAAAIGRWRVRTGDRTPLVKLLEPGAGMGPVLRWADDPGCLVERCRAAYWSLADREVVWVDVSLLRALRNAGVSVCACTGRNRRQAAAAFRRLGFEPDAVRTMEDALKPDPAALLPLLDGVATAWFCGDSVDDERCADNARPLTSCALSFARVVHPGEPPISTHADVVTVGIDPFLRELLEAVRG